MIRRSVFCFVLMYIACFAGFGQASAIRDYVGMISQGFHPDSISFLEDLKRDIEREGRSETARVLENYIKGESGTGFVYVADDGKNYIITNFHVISLAHTLTVSFETPDGERTRFSDLTIVAADEDMDIALLTFAGGQNPFREGLAFLSRPVQDGDDVYSAGFPGLGTAMIWQFGRGIVSNSSVRLPDPDDDTKRIGPYIQHTAQVDPGNSGGPLLIQTTGVPTGYAVAGINTLSARYRQGANFSIPMNRVRSFLDTSLKPPAEDDLTRLNARLASFIEGLSSTKAAYPHIAEYLSNACTGENVEYAWSEVRKAPSAVRQDIIRTFNSSPVDGMTCFVAWVIEKNLRSGTGTMSVTTGSVIPAGDGRYKVTFNANGKTIDSEWENEYGIWRIRTFGDFASGDRAMVEKRRRSEADAANLRANPGIQIAAGFINIVDRGAALGLDLIIRGAITGFGLNAYVAPGFFQIETMSGFYIPIKISTVAFTPFVQLGAGLQFKEMETMEADFSGNVTTNKAPFIDYGISFKGGLQFTMAAVPGLYFQAAYQRNLYLASTIADRLGANEFIKPDKDLLCFSLGYSF